MFKQTPTDDRGIDLLTDPIDASGALTDFQREAPNGRFVERDPPRTEFGVDRTARGRFASRDTTPVPQVRGDDGTVESDAYAVGNFGAFDGGDGRFKTTDRGGRR